jgi:hypothetical protein
MQRRYDVYIEGKPLVIADAPLFSTVPGQWAVLRVDHVEEIADAVGLLSSSKDLLASIFSLAGSLACGKFSRPITFR